jgi:hypothetical protein
MYRLAFGPTHPPIQWVMWALSPETKHWGNGVDQPLPFSAKVKNDRDYTFTPLVCLHGMDRDSFTSLKFYSIV